MFELISLLLFVTFFSNVLMGIMTLIYDIHRPINRGWGMVVFSVSWWTLGVILYNFFQNDQYIDAIIKFLYIAPPLIALAWLYFAYAFVGRLHTISTFRKVIVSLPAFILIILVIFTDTVVAEGFTRSTRSEPYASWGILYPLFVVYMIIYFSWPFLIMLNFLKRAKGVIRDQARIILLGTGVSIFIGLVSNLILPTFNIFHTPELGPIGTIVMVGSITYAMMKYHLFGVRFVFNKLFLWFGLAFFIYISYYLVSYFYISVYGSVFSVNTYALGVIISFFVAVILVSPLATYLQLLADKLFYKGHNPHNNIQDIVYELKNANNIGEFFLKLKQYVKQNLHVNFLDIVIFSDGECLSLYAEKEQYPLASLKRLQIVSSVFRRSIFKNEMMLYGKNHIDRGLFDTLGIQIAMPFFEKDVEFPMCFIFLSRSSMAADYYREDLFLLEDLRESLSVRLIELCKKHQG